MNHRRRNAKMGEDMFINTDANSAYNIGIKSTVTNMTTVLIVEAKCNLNYSKCVCIYIYTHTHTQVYSPRIAMMKTTTTTSITTTTTTTTTTNDYITLFL
jgi:hypothetical protein